MFLLLFIRNGQPCRRQIISADHNSHQFSCVTKVYCPLSQQITSTTCFILYNRQINTVSGCSVDPLSPVVGSSLVYPTSPMAAPLNKASPGLPSANSTPNKRVLATTSTGALITPGQLGQPLSSPLNLVSRVTGSPMGVKAQVISSVRDDQGSSLSPIAPNTATNKQQILTAQLAQLMQSNLTPSVLQSLSKIPLGKLNLNSLLNSASTNNNSINASSTVNYSDTNNSTSADS